MGENNFSEKEKDIENAIKVMLKGVSEHTAVSEIRAKLQKAADEDLSLIHISCACAPSRRRP